MQGKPAVILIVEDDSTLRYLAKRQLTRLGYQCDFAADGVEAVEMTGRYKYVVIFMDVQMPKMDGFEATRAIRKRESESNDEISTPIIGITAHPEMQECYASGMNDFVFKPVSMELMEQTVKRWA